MKTAELNMDLTENMPEAGGTYRSSDDSSSRPCSSVSTDHLPARRPGLEYAYWNLVCRNIHSARFTESRKPQIVSCTRLLSVVPRNPSRKLRSTETACL